MQKRLITTAILAIDVLLQEFRSEIFHFFGRRISVFRKYASYFRIYFNDAKSLINKGIKGKPVEMSHRKGSDFNRLFNPLSYLCLISLKVINWNANSPHQISSQ